VSSEVKRAGAELRALARGPGSRGFVGLPAFLVFLADCWRFLNAITFAGDGNDLRVMQEPIEDGPGADVIKPVHFHSGLRKRIA